MREYKLIEAESAVELAKLITALLSMRRGPPPHPYVWSTCGSPFAALAQDGRQRFYQAIESK